MQNQHPPSAFYFFKGAYSRRLPSFLKLVHTAKLIKLAGSDPFTYKFTSTFIKWKCFCTQFLDIPQVLTEL